MGSPVLRCLGFTCQETYRFDRSPADFLDSREVKAMRLPSFQRHIFTMTSSLLEIHNVSSSSIALLKEEMTVSRNTIIASHANLSDYCLRENYCSVDSIHGTKKEWPLVSS